MAASQSDPDSWESLPPLKVAVVGSGHLGRFHARIWSQHPLVELVAVVDTHPERARELAQELGCAALGNSSELIGRVDAVCVATPANRHGEAAIELLERGIACLVEKPLGADLTEAQAIVDAADRGGAVLAVGHSERFQPPLLWAQGLGLKPRRMRFERRVPRGPRGREVGVVHDLMVHDLHLSSLLAGGEPIGIELLEHDGERVAVRLHFAAGIEAELVADRSSLDPARFATLETEAERIELDLVQCRARRGPLGGQPSDWILFEGALRPLQAELFEFHRRLCAGRPQVVDGRAGLLAVRWADRIEALAYGRTQR